MSTRKKNRFLLQQTPIKRYRKHVIKFQSQQTSAYLFLMIFKRKKGQSENLISLLAVFFKIYLKNRLAWRILRSMTRKKDFTCIGF